MLCRAWIFFSLITVLSTKWTLGTNYFRIFRKKNFLIIFLAFPIFLTTSQISIAVIFMPIFADWFVKVESLPTYGWTQYCKEVVPAGVFIGGIAICWNYSYKTLPEEYLQSMKVFCMDPVSANLSWDLFLFLHSLRLC